MATYSVLNTRPICIFGITKNWPASTQMLSSRYPIIFILLIIVKHFYFIMTAVKIDVFAIKFNTVKL